jgi:hypothetical protein
MSREAHYESVYAAINGIGEVGQHVVAGVEHRRSLAEQTALMAEKQQQALGLIIAAVGDDPATHSSRNALEFTQVLGSKIEDLSGLLAAMDERLAELARITDNTVQELNRYLNGF